MKRWSAFALAVLASLLMGHGERWPGKGAGASGGAPPPHTHTYVRLQFAANVVASGATGGCFQQVSGLGLTACSLAANSYVYVATTPSAISLACLVIDPGLFDDVAGNMLDLRPVYIQSGSLFEGATILQLVGSTTVAGMEYVGTVTSTSPHTGAQSIGLRMVLTGGGLWTLDGIRCGLQIF